MHAAEIARQTSHRGRDRCISKAAVAAKKKQKRSLNSSDTGKSLDWLKIADAVCGHSWTRIYQSNLPHDSPIQDLPNECIRRKCNAFIINKTIPSVCN